MRCHPSGRAGINSDLLMFIYLCIYYLIITLPDLLLTLSMFIYFCYYFSKLLSKLLLLTMSDANIGRYLHKQVLGIPDPH